MCDSHLKLFLGLFKQNCFRTRGLLAESSFVLILIGPHTRTQGCHSSLQIRATFCRVCEVFSMERAGMLQVIPHYELPSVSEFSGFPLALWRAFARVASEAESTHIEELLININLHRQEVNSISYKMCWAYPSADITEHPSNILKKIPESPVREDIEVTLNAFHLSISTNTDFSFSRCWPGPLWKTSDFVVVPSAF